MCHLTDLHKYIIIGDFIEIISRLLQEQTGWVKGIEGETVHVVEYVSVEKWEDTAQLCCIKVNYVIVFTA
jgi:hypothetical protein